MEDLQEGQRVKFRFHESTDVGTILGSEAPYGITLYRVLPDSQKLKKYVHEQLGRDYFIFRHTNVVIAEPMLKEDNPNSTFKRRIRE